MRKLYVIVLCVYAVLSSVSGALANDTYCFYYAERNTPWSSTGTSRGTGWSQWVGDTEVLDGSFPNSDTANVYFQYNQTGISVDGNYTVSRLYVNNDMSTTTGKVYVDMEQTWTDYTNIYDGSLNLVGDNSHDVTSVAGLSGESYYFAIYGNWSGRISREITFAGGEVNITDSNSRTAVLGAYSTQNTMTLSFVNGNKLNVSQDLLLAGGRQTSSAESTVVSEFNFAGTVNVGTYDDSSKTWTCDKNIYVGTPDTLVKNNTSEYAIKTNISGTVNANTVYMRPNTSVSVTGTLNAAGGVFLSYAATGGDWSNSSFDKFEVSKGAVANLGFLRAYSGAIIDIDGEVNISSSNSGTSIYLYSGYLNFGENATYNAKGSNSSIEVGGSIVLNAQKGKITIGTGKISLLSTSSAVSGPTKVVLNTSDAFRVSDTVGQEGIYISINSSTSSESSAYRIEVNANQNLDSIRFAKANNAVSIIFDAAVTEFNMTSLSNGTLNSENDAKIVIDGFKLNMIHFNSWNSDDDLSLVSSADGDWTDFELVSDGGTGYYLSATYIPEPSDYAAFFGVLVLAFAAFRGRK